MSLVEIKRQHEIGREVVDEMVEKVRRFPRRDDVFVRTALVYEGHLAPIVEADGYFDAVIPFRQLLGPSESEMAGAQNILVMDDLFNE